MSGREFYAQDASARASWRLAVLMGANSRTYKFALGQALLEFGRAGREAVPVAEFSGAYSLGLVRHLARDPQAPHAQERGEKDFLTVAERESAATLASGHPTERLLAAAVHSMPGMVMQKFHNLRGDTAVPHTFYELTGRGGQRMVRLTPDVLRLAQSEHAVGLTAELEARWSIVESSFAAGVGRSLLEEGVAVDWDTLKITDKRRRRSVTGIVEATAGFQHGRCLICRDLLTTSEAIAVDHIFPFSLMRRFAGVGSWHGPDLDALWNLAPAHAVCNGAKSDRLPTQAELAGLAARNEAIMNSPHPLRRTLQLSLKSHLPRQDAASWAQFLQAVQAAI
ncbi:HNH endonuclease domain-containing protein [Streptomyces sp. NBC_00687]|uniref:HNH endonuclease domain-containing protein n=1 Tax=Streptomyces sp. NBC_00687 TaxID=2975807 RepID=UPI0022512282|nr:HNH endonuclease domain-containing protein [Streptomyces sp. NBC_00687]MCX4920186.1 HNH endonuclease [Streptomyces sp. NBC_00687]